VAHSAAKIKEEVPPNCVFEEWSPLGFKYTVSRFRAKDFFSLPRRGLVSPSCLGLINSMEFTFPIGHSNHKFDLLYSKRVFVHHYSSAGLEEMELVEAR
jgi:tubulin alpha